MMKASRLIRFRQILGGLYLLAFLVIFLDVFHMISPRLFDAVTFFQFIPSVISFFDIFSLAAVGFIVVIVITLLLGRFYCASLCPLGSLMDVLTRLSTKIRGQKKFRYLKRLSWVRYPLLVVTIITLLAGFMPPLNVLDPYSVFGKISVQLFQPVFIALNNLVAGLSELAGTYSFYHIKVDKPEIISLSVSLVLFGSITVMAVLNGRIFCNTVCPVGTLLGLLSGKALFRVKINPSVCNHCHKCTTVCKASCIDSNHQYIDYSRCVSCFNCLGSCSLDAMSFSAGIGNHNNDINIKSRRTFLSRLILGSLFLSQKAVAQEVADSTAINEEPEKDKPVRNFPVSPPGSLNIERFNSLCTGCNLCISACPTNVLQPAALEYGLQGLMQPRMNYLFNYCNYDCLACGQVCPTGAITELNKEEKHKTQMGKVNLIWKLCIVYTERKDCGACSEHCPSKSVQMVEWEQGLKKPTIHQDVCIGCGACEFMCPTKPFKAIYVDGNPVHLVAKPPRKEKPEYIFNPEDDFPF